MKSVLTRIGLLIVITIFSFILLDGGTNLFGDYNEITSQVTDPLSFAYLGFLAITVLLYYVLPSKCQKGVLLVASIIFYTMSGIQFIVFLAGAAAITFITAKQISARIEVTNEKLAEAKGMKEKKALKAELQSSNKGALAIALIATLGVMVIIKYTYFFMENINNLLNIGLPLVSLIMPLGLSFYTFILIAYIMDVHRGKYPAEQKFSRFLLFVSFFPHVSQGPIARYDELVTNQFAKNYSFNYQNFCFGMQRILWGFFIKLVLADRLSIFVTGVYDDYQTQSWLMLIIAAMAFSIQIYADFYSSMEIAIGSAQLFGITLTENFMRPYFSKSMPEFWRRWHITLGTWFKDYVFYPIAISKRLMKFGRWSRDKFGMEASKILTAIPPIMGVWILTGLWHGAAWNFVAWGVYHGILIVLSTIFAEYISRGFVKIGIKTESWDFKVIQMIKVFILCTIGRIFFAAGSIDEAISIFKSIISMHVPKSGLIDITNVPLLIEEYYIIAIATALLLITSIVQESIGSMRVQIDNANIWIRWSIWIFLIFSTIIFGVYGTGAPSEFIYDEF